MKLKITLLTILISCLAFAQESKEAKKEAKIKAKALTNSKNLTWEGNKALSEDNFVQAEGNFRKAISKSNENAAAPFNLGTAYYNKETYSEAFGRFKQAGELASSKADKHKAYHNMGNVFMKNKEYQKAVDAYKEALRNNPTDEETRYNLALAKELLKKQQDEDKKNEDKKDKNKDKNKDQDKKDENKDGEKKEDDKGKEDENKDGDKDNKDKGDEGEEKNEKEKDGKGDDEKKKPNEPKKPRPNQLSKQQIKNLLQAMQNEEKKVQQKMDEKKMKGVKVKSEKDW